jgi:hypothetical protein
MISSHKEPSKKTSAPAPAAAVKGDWPGPAMDDFLQPPGATDCW